VPLSEHEQRLLEQMERALYAEDPKFATSMRSARGGAGDRKRIVVGVIAVLVGLGLLIAGVASKLVVVGVLGFLAMLGGIWLVIRSMRAAPEQAAAPGAGGPAAPTDITSRSRKTRQKRSGESLSDRMEERWRRRRETGDF
jgi:predicted lipid-binding transport protein (Tim44 family)